MLIQNKPEPNTFRQHTPRQDICGENTQGKFIPRQNTNKKLHSKIDAYKNTQTKTFGKNTSAQNTQKDISDENQSDKTQLNKNHLVKKQNIPRKNTH